MQTSSCWVISSTQTVQPLFQPPSHFVVGYLWLHVVDERILVKAQQECVCMDTAWHKEPSVVQSAEL